MPGDKIRIINKQVYVNDKPIKKIFYKTKEEQITKRYRDVDKILNQLLNTKNIQIIPKYTK